MRRRRRRNPNFSPRLANLVGAGIGAVVGWAMLSPSLMNTESNLSGSQAAAIGAGIGYVGTSILRKGEK